LPGSVSAWLKALKPFQSRPDLIRARAHGKGKGTAVAAKSALKAKSKPSNAKKPK